MDAGGGEDMAFDPSMKKKKKKRVIDTEVAQLEAKLEEAGIVEDNEQEPGGDDPFAKAEGGDEAPLDDDGREQEEQGWLNSDRDYTYEEVCPSLTRPLADRRGS
jgi:hypothetical protein